MSSITSKSSSEGCLSVKFSTIHVVLIALLAFLGGTLCPSIIPSKAKDPAPRPGDAPASIPGDAACLEPSDAVADQSAYSSEPSSWCPTATCYNTDLCKPCSRRYLIILATGRSASTTLMNMMGELPEVRMAGENNDLLKHLKNIEDQTLQKPTFVHNHEGDLTNWKDAWRHNPILNGSLACVSQQLIETINPPRVDEEGHFLIKDEDNKILGFKTVRLLVKVNEKRDEEIANWLIETMPCARYLVNIRSDVEAQASSQTSAFNGYTAGVDGISDMNRRMHNLQKSLGSSRAYMLDGTKWTQNISMLNEALVWLGYSGSCNFTKALEYNTGGGGYQPGDVDTSDLMVDASKCRYIGDEMRR